MSNEFSVTFNLQFEIPAGQEIKDVSVSIGEVTYSSPIWYCDEYGSPYVDHKGNQIELKAWPQYYIDNYGRRIEIPSIEKDRREKENQIRQKEIERIQRQQDAELQEQHRRLARERMFVAQAEADRLWSEAAHRRFLAYQYEKKIQKDFNWKEEGF